MLNLTAANFETILKVFFYLSEINVMRKCSLGESFVHRLQTCKNEKFDMLFIR